MTRAHQFDGPVGSGDEGRDPEDEIRVAVADLLDRSSALHADTAQRHERIALLRARLETLAARLVAGSEAGPVLPTPAGAGEPREGAGSERALPAPAVIERVSRRRMLALTGMGVVGGAVTAAVANAAPAGASAPVGSPLERLTAATTTSASEEASASISITDGMVYVPAPTGVAATDTANILEALSTATAGTTVVLACSNTTAVYVIDQELPVPPGIRITAVGVNDEQPFGSSVNGYMATLQQAAGSSLRCVLASAGYLAGLYGPSNPGSYSKYNSLYNDGTAKLTADSAIEVDHVAFDGQNGGMVAGNTQGHAVVLYSNGSKVHDCYIFDTPQVGIVVADANYAGTPGTGPFLDNRIYDNKMFNSGAQGIWVTSTAGSTGCLSGYLLNNVVESPSKQTQSTPTTADPPGLGSPNIDPGTGLPYEAVRLDNSAGWWVVNNHAYSCPGSGWYLGAAWGLHLIDNSTDTLGAFPTNGATYVGYDLVLDGSGLQFQPAFVNGNQVSAYEGFNSNDFITTNKAPNTTNTYRYYRVTMKVAAQQNPAPASYIEHADNASHQDSQPAGPVAGAKVTEGSSTVTFSSTVSALLQAGMSVVDNTTPANIPSGTFIGAVGSSSITLVDADGNPVDAVGSGKSDTLSFPGPTSVGWTYVNDLADSTLVVYRTNELVSAPIDGAAALSGVGAVDLVDPAGFAGGVPVTGTPTAGQTIVATSATAATWGAPPAGAPSGSAGGVLAGSYPNPRLAPSLSTTLTESGDYRVPAGATRVRVTCVGAGGGGGGGGAAATGVAQVGGSGGAAGTTSIQIVRVEDDPTLAVTVGEPGAGGSGGTRAGNHTGGDGTGGGDTTVEGREIFVRGSGGSGGLGGVGGSTTVRPGAAYGAPAGTASAFTTAGCGGASAGAGGLPIASSSGGGGGGGSSGRLRGGGGGGAGSDRDGGSAGRSASMSGGGGGPGTKAADRGAGGGGGGGGVKGGAGGAGGHGGAGFVIIEVVG